MISVACLGTLVIATVVVVADDKAPAPQDSIHDKEPVFVGYLYGPARALDYKLYTHLCHAFVVADADGKIRSGGGAPSKKITDEAHQAGVKVLLSLGGWGWDKQFAEMLQSKEAEDRYVHDVLQMVEEYGYDGIDLDWEYPDTADEVKGFERLTRRFRAGMNEQAKKRNQPMRLTMAAAANPSTLKWLETPFLIETMDWVNVMTYDMAGDWTPYAGHHSPLHSSSKVANGGPSTERTIRYLLEERKLPPDKIALGIPLYGRGFAVSEPFASTKDQPKGARPPGGSYSRIHKLETQDGWKRRWDTETKSPWLIAPDNSSVICFDDPESVALKVSWANGKKLRGIFFWEVNGDRLADGSNPVQAAAHNVWVEGKLPPAPAPREPMPN